MKMMLQEPAELIQLRCALLDCGASEVCSSKKCTSSFVPLESVICRGFDGRGIIFCWLIYLTFEILSLILRYISVDGQRGICIGRPVAGTL